MVSALDQFDSEIKETLKSLYPNPQAQEMLERRWTTIRAQACQNAGTKWGDLRPEAMEKMRQAIQQVVIAVDTVGYRPLTITNHSRSEELVRHLFYPQASIPLLTWEELECIVYKFNPEVIAGARAQIEAIFPHLLSQIRGEHPEMVTKALVNHVIALYAFLSPQDGKIVQILQKIEGRWKLVSYKIEKIRLTESRCISSASAWGFVPQEEEKAFPLLLFRGTSYPSDEGAYIDYKADFTPGLSIGELIYREGKENIRAFIERFPEKIIQLHGQSLGGALALLTGEDFPKRTQLHAVAAPGQLPWTVKAIREEGTMTYHEHDMAVPIVGFFPESLKLQKALTFDLPGEAARTVFHGHLLPAVGCGPSILMHVDTKQENARPIRKVSTVFHQIFSVPIFALLSAFEWGVLRLIALIQKVARVFSCSPDR